MFNDYPTIGTPDGMLAMTKEEMAERDKRQYLAIEKALRPSIRHGEDQRKLMNTYMNGYFHELEKTREKLERKPKPTMWQRFKSWIAC